MRFHHATLLILVVALEPAWGQEKSEPATGQVVPAKPFDRDLLVGIEDRAPVRNADENEYEYRSYNQVLLEASRVSPAGLAAGARHDLTYAHLFEEPAKYRGQVVHLSGRLRRLRQFDAPALAAARE